MTAPDPEIEDIEIALLLEGAYRRYGYDFRQYAPGSLRRRVRRIVEAEGVPTASALLEKLLRDPGVMERFLLGLTVHVTSMFRDPHFFRALRETVVPLLRTYPFLRIWNAGCSTGEEVYSIAILLREEGLYDRARIYATDMNEAVLRRAKEGIFPLQRMQEYTANYVKAGGKASFSEYYTAGHEHAIFRPVLKENVVFSLHNLAVDGSFNEFHLILCRNVMIYFNRQLQERVLNLFHESLTRRGVLGLGNRETLKLTPHEAKYQLLNDQEKLYRRMA
jgi:chemotaxis protein methyltransferase CheR